MYLRQIKETGNFQKDIQICKAMIKFKYWNIIIWSCDSEGP